MKYILCMLLLICGAHLMAQNKQYSIEGKISDQQGEYIPFGYVMIDSIHLGTAITEDGSFLLSDVPSGTHKVTARVAGFYDQTIIVVVNKKSLSDVDFILEEKVNEVVISGKVEEENLKSSAEAVEIVETKEAKLKSSDLGEVMARTEGISVLRAGGLGSNTRFALNGLSSDQIRFFYDGIPLNFTSYAFGIANVPVNAISRVEVYKGVVPIQFGADALGGAVNLVSPKISHGWSGGASYQAGSFNTHRATVNLAYANDRSGWFSNAGGFFDYTDNNYKIDAIIPNEKGKPQQHTVKRFHDGYKAYGVNLRVGIRDKKWAKELSIEGYYGNYTKKVQNSQSPGLVDYPQLGIDKAVGGNPFGDMVFTSFAQGLNLNYNIHPTTKWEVDLKAGYNYSQRVSIDTSHSVYNWYGERIRIKKEAGEFGEADHLITKSQNYFARQQLSYNISNNHSLKFSVAPTYSFRTGDNLLIEGKYDPALKKGYLFDLVTGLEYRGKVVKEKLQIIAFAKNYRQSFRVEWIDPSVAGQQVDKRSVSNYGAGAGLRYAWTARFATKLSYEYAYRLPRQDEIFGDGQLVGENLKLRPENSHNVNLQWNIDNKATAKIEWQIQGNFFLRRVNDLIFLVVNPEGFGLYQNIWSANSQGVELGGKVVNIIKGLSINGNTTYQSYLNTSDKGPFASFKGDRIPNAPYFFINGGAEYQLQNVFPKNGTLSVFWNTRYVQAYFTGWESAGAQQYKAEVPNQLTHIAGITQRMNIKNIQTALTLEVQNLTNAKVFDYYGVQRPGRAFYIKLTTQF
jgi:vitamin B12 transporter